MKNGNSRNRIVILAAVLLIGAAAVLACIFLIKPGQVKKNNADISFLDVGGRIDEIIGRHDGEDFYTGVGGRSDTEAEINYMILKYATGLEDQEKKDPDDGDDTPDGGDDTPDGGDDTPDGGDDTPDGGDDTPDGGDDETPGGGDDETPGGGDDETPDDGDETPEPEKPEPDENWDDILFDMFKDVEYRAYFYTDMDVDDDLVLAVMRCNAEYRTGEHGILFSRYGTQNTKVNGIKSWTVSVDYFKDRDEILKIKEDTAAKEDEVVSTLDYSGLTDFEKIDLINQYVCDHVDYYPEQPYPDISHTAYCALFENYAVCDGFSRLVKMMCDDMGVECRIIIGDVLGGGGHAWNLVKLDGQWYHLDVTWNDGCGDRSAYFLIPDSYLNKERVWEEGLYPATATAPYVR